MPARQALKIHGWSAANSLRAIQVARPHIRSRPPATSRCRCSQNTPPVISGTSVPKQVGQSGQARLEWVAWTTLPRKRSSNVHTTVTVNARVCSDFMGGSACWVATIAPGRARWAWGRLDRILPKSPSHRASAREVLSSKGPEMAKKRVPHLLPKAINPLRQMKLVGRWVRRATKKPGAPPGTLVHTGVQKVERLRIRYLDYDAEQLSEAEVEDVQRCFPFKDSPTVSWINIDGLHDVELIRAVGERFGWHPLMLEDIVSVGQRAKMEEYDGVVFIVLPMLGWNAERAQVEEEQLSVILGERYVFTFQERFGDVFESVRERLRNARGRIRQRGPDYLAYALIDAVVDHYFAVIEAVGEITDDLEAEVLVDPVSGTMQRLHLLKRELISVRRAVWPLREMLNQLLRTEGAYFSKETRIFARDVHDHAVQVAETVDALRDVVSGAVDLYLSTMSQRTNEVMKVLTIMASIFIPLTFMAGVYGMNFDFMPELHVWWAYPALLGVMLLLGGTMLLYFKRKGWL